MTEILPKCPQCGSSNIFYRHERDEYECLSCRHKWRKGEEKPVEEEKTWLIRDEALVEVEGRVEEPLETPVEAPEEAGEPSG